MRVSLFAASVALAFLGLAAWMSSTPVKAEEPCTGDNCQSPQGGGHDCEHEKKEQTVS